MATKPRRPNFLVILADDLGYSDIGCFGSEIQTPNIDELARNGARFTNYYTASACSPTRAMLMSGTDNHIAGVGVMNEQKGVDPNRWNVKGHEGFLNHDVAALSELLQDNGYYTMISGKWHLGLKPQNNPAARGFDRSFALVPGCANHFGWEPQFKNGDCLSFCDQAPPLYTEEGRKYEMEPNMESSPDGFFSSDFYTDNLIDNFLRARRPEHADKPWFAYLPFSAPHWPLQCYAADRAKYKGMYDDGPEALRQRRLKRLQELSLVAPGVEPHEVVAQASSKEWGEMSEYERRCSARAMECFAGMVDNIDQNIGKVVRYLKETGEFDNTFIIFQSDNGAEGAEIEAAPVMGPSLMNVISKYYDNSIENIGNVNSFVWYGTRWAQASTAPSRLYKMYTTEGGIHVPLVVYYPGFASSRQNGAVINTFSTVMDICPTILDLAGIEHPTTAGKLHRGRKVAPLRGKSWVPFMTGSSTVVAGDSIHPTSSAGAMGWELFGRGAVRQGNWKLVHVDASVGGGKWQLYDLAKDPGEVHDKSDEHPDIVSRLLGLWDTYCLETGVVWGKEVDHVGRLWDGPPRDVIGGNMLDHTTAWMKVRGGAVPVID